MSRTSKPPMGSRQIRFASLHFGGYGFSPRFAVGGCRAVISLDEISLPMGATVAKEPEKRGRGRPAKLPKEGRHDLRCVVIGTELDEVRSATKKLGVSQAEFTRRAVMELVRKVNGK